MLRLIIRFLCECAFDSRSTLFELKPFEEEILKLLSNAISNQERGLGKMNLEVKEDALRHIARFSDGDARKALNSIEIAL